MRLIRGVTDTGGYDMGLIVNADDFGRSESVNRAICEAFEKGRVNSTTLMANMPAAKEAYELAKKGGFADKVGIHLNITEGMPISSGIRNNPLICGYDGSFNQAFYHNTKYRLYMDRQSIDQIRDEFDAQIRRFLSLGFTNMHIDSHHHVHTNYPVFTALKELGTKYDLDYIRLSRNLYKGGSLPNRIYKSFFNARVKKLAGSTSDLFGSYKDFISYPREELKALINSKTIEIMIHPMYGEDRALMDTDIPISEEIFDIAGL